MRHPRATTRASTAPEPVRGGTGAVGTAELDGEALELLPRRDTLCYIGCVNVTTVVGVNLAFAINAASANATANALAAQYLVAFR
jgi:hypothetical protein